MLRTRAVSLGSRGIRPILATRNGLYSQTYASTASVQDYDVVIVGGGPVGLALACALVSPLRRDSSLRVALIEASDLSAVRKWQPEGDSFSNRVSSITNASREFLQGIGAWDLVDESRTMAIEEMQVWDGVSDARIEFGEATLPSGRGLEMARLTENLNLQRALLRRLDNLSSPTFTILDKTKVSSIVPDTERSTWPVVHLHPSQSSGVAHQAPERREQTSPLPLRARLLVGADGPSSPVRAFSKIETYGWSYDARAIVATMVHDGNLLTSFGTPRNTTTAYQRFLPTGPIAFLPLSTTRASLVWSTTPELAQALLDAGDDVLARMVNAAFRLPDLSMRYLHQFILDRWHAAVPEVVGADGKMSKKGYLGVDEIEGEIRWRERAHSIDASSALSSLPDATTRTSSGMIPSADAEFYPPLVGHIQARSAASFPLRMAHAERYLGQGVRTALIGDAAHTTHPLAGQGLNLGLGDCQSLANAIHTAHSLGQDVGSFTALESYPRQRYLVNHGMLSAVDKLKKLYGTRNGPIVWARSVGLETINELDGLKRMFMGVAGADGDADRVVRRRTPDRDIGRSENREGISTASAEAASGHSSLGNREEVVSRLESTSHGVPTWAGMLASAVEGVAGMVDVGTRILRQRF